MFIIYKCLCFTNVYVLQMFMFYKGHILTVPSEDPVTKLNVNG